MRKSLSRKERLKKKIEFSRIFNDPDYRLACKGGKLLVKRNGLEFNRFAASFVRKYGNAVKRNYARRVVKNIYRENNKSLPTGYDFILILYPGEFDYYDRKQQFLGMLRRVDFACS